MTSIAPSPAAELSDKERALAWLREHFEAYCDDDDSGYLEDPLEDLIADIRAEVRESCAKIADEMYECDNVDCRGCIGCATGKAIRAAGSTK